MFPGVELKISPNGLHRLFMAEHPMVIAPAVPDDAVTSREGPDEPRTTEAASGMPGPDSSQETAPESVS